MWRGIFIAMLGSAVLLSHQPIARGQIIFTPLQSQYILGGRPLFYGGADPAVFAFAATDAGNPTWGRSNGFAFHRGDVRSHREVSNELPRVFCDARPFEDGRTFGFSACDAINASYGAEAHYFRKRDLIAGAIHVDGMLIVPALQQPPAVGENGAGYLPRPAGPMPRILILPPGLPMPRQPSDNIRMVSR